MGRQKNILEHHQMHLFSGQTIVAAENNHEASSGCACVKYKLSQVITVKVGLTAYWVMELLLLCCAGGADGGFAGGRMRLLFSVDAGRGGAVSAAHIQASLGFLISQH